jgi:hypothetical protein
MITPTAIHMTATKARNPGLDGRRPMVTGLSGSRDLGRLVRPASAGRGGPPFGVTRPLEPDLRGRVAMPEHVSAHSARGRR